jgi:DNA-binding IscR family transcriptional regulator
MIQNLRLKNGFGQVSNDVIRDPHLTLSQKAIYAYLATFASSDKNELTVSVSKIASECNVNESTVGRIFKELIDKKIISRTPRGKGKTYLTTLLK